MPSYQPVNSTEMRPRGDDVRKAASNDNDTTSHQSASTIEQWFSGSLGYKAQASMVGLLLLAMIIAIANYLTFRFLDGRAVDSVGLSQSYIGAGSVGFAFLFKAALVTSIWTAFSQWLWYLLRTRHTQVSVIDDLTKILYDSTTLLSWGAIKFSPLLYLCALLSWSVALSTIFPPGALIVAARPFRVQEPAVVSVYDPGFMGNRTTRDIQSNALFSLTDFGGYFDPKPHTSRIARETILQQRPLDIRSPCGQNCSYSLTTASPYYVCTPGLRNATTTLRRIEQSSPFIYLANQTSSSENFSFEAEWFSSHRYNFSRPADDLTRNGGIYGERRNLSCDVWSAILEIDVEYINGLPTFKTEAKPIQPLPAKALRDGGLFSPNATHIIDDVTYAGDGDELAVTGASQAELQALVTELISRYSDGSGAFTHAAQDYVWHDDRLFVPDLSNVSTAYEMSNVRTIHDAVSQALTGTGNYLWTSLVDEINIVLQANIENSFRLMGQPEPGLNLSISERLATRWDNLPSSLILGSAMAVLDPIDFTAVNLTISADMLNSLLQNTTISLMSVPNTNRTILITKMDNRNVYVFERPANLIVPYAVSLLLSTLFVIIGLRSLYANGSPASVGGFLQILRTTQGGQTLHEVASQAARRDATHEDRQALKNLKIRLGDLASTYDRSVDTTDGNGSVIVGFGVESELSSVKRQGTRSTA